MTTVACYGRGMMRDKKILISLLALAVTTGAILLVAPSGDSHYRAAGIQSLPRVQPRTIAPAPLVVEPAGSPCAAYIAAVPPEIIRAAGNPRIACEPHPAGAAESEAGRYTIDGIVHVYPDTYGYDPATFYPYVIAHELGHAYADKNIENWFPYVDARGLSRPGANLADQVAISEDYAETFAYALGLWQPIGIAPRGFHNVAGAPTQQQIDALRAAHLLP